MSNDEMVADAVRKLDALNGDPEQDHGDAEDIVLDLLTSMGHKEVAEAFARAASRVGFWYA